MDKVQRVHCSCGGGRFYDKPQLHREDCPKFFVFQLEAENQRLEARWANLYGDHGAALQRVKELEKVILEGWEDSFNNWVIPSEYVFDVLPQAGQKGGKQGG